MTALSAALFVAIFLLVSQTHGELHAYLDPGTGSIAIQFILGALVAVLATVRLYWDRLRAFVRRRTAAPSVVSDRR
jgi:hypothetical protein